MFPSPLGYPMMQQAPPSYNMNGGMGMMNNMGMMGNPMMMANMGMMGNGFGNMANSGYMQQPPAQKDTVDILPPQPDRKTKRD